MISIIHSEHLFNAIYSRNSNVRKHASGLHYLLFLISLVDFFAINLWHKFRI